MIAGGLGYGADVALFFIGLVLIVWAVTSANSTSKTDGSAVEHEEPFPDVMGGEAKTK